MVCKRDSRRFFTTCSSGDVALTGSTKAALAHSNKATKESCLAEGKSACEGVGGMDKAKCGVKTKKICIHTHFGSQFFEAPGATCIQADDCNSDSPCTGGRCETTMSVVEAQGESPSCDATIVKTTDDDGEPLADKTYGKLTGDVPSDAE